MTHFHHFFQTIAGALIERAFQKHWFYIFCPCCNLILVFSFGTYLSRACFTSSPPVVSDTTPVVMAPLYSLRDSSGVIALPLFFATTNYLLARAQFLLDQSELFFINLDQYYI